MPLLLIATHLLLVGCFALRGPEATPLTLVLVKKTIANPTTLVWCHIDMTVSSCDGRMAGKMWERGWVFIHDSVPTTCFEEERTSSTRFLNQVPVTLFACGLLELLSNSECHVAGSKPCMLWDLAPLAPELSSFGSPTLPSGRSRFASLFTPCGVSI